MNISFGGKKFSVAVFALSMLCSCGNSEVDLRRIAANKTEKDKKEFIQNGDLGALARIETTATSGTVFERVYALTAIGSIVRTKHNIPESTKKILVNALVSSEPLERREAAFAINEFEHGLDIAIPNLISIIKIHSGSDASRTAADILGKMGKNAAEALPALKQAMQSSDSILSRRATEAVNSIEVAMKSTAPVP